MNLLKRLVEINSVFPNEEKISQFLSDYLKKIGFKIQHVETAKNRKNIVAAFGVEKKYLAFYGHMDTTPPDKGYKSDPFKLKIENNGKIARGLGVGDMKGGIAAILRAADFASQNNLPLKIIFGVDEENISEGAHNLVESGLLNDIDFLIVGESGQIKNINQPFIICYGRKGRILFDIEIIGRKAHAAESKKTINVIEKASILIQKIKKIKFPNDKKLGKTAIVYQTIKSEADSFSTPDYCLIQCSVLTNSYTKGPEFQKKVIQIAERLNILINIQPHKRKTPYGESYLINNKHHFLKKIEKYIIIPNKIIPIYASSVADENVFANRLNIPVLTLGPVGGCDHTKDEWVNLLSLRTVINIYQQIIKLYHGNNF